MSNSTTNQNNKNQETAVIKKITAGTIGYTGEVTITKRCKNKVLAKYKAHNEGCSILFNYLVSCLNGNYAQRQSGMPKRLQLIYNKAELATAKPWDAGYTSVVSQSISFYSPPTVNLAKVDDQTGPASITFHFLVPYSAFINPIGDSTGDNEGLIPYNQLNLYSNIGTTDKPLAAFYLVKEDMGRQIWNTQSIRMDDTSRGYNLLVDWTLTIGNTKPDEGSSTIS